MIDISTSHQLESASNASCSEDEGQNSPDVPEPTTTRSSDTSEASPPALKLACDRDAAFNQELLEPQLRHVVATLVADYCRSSYWYEKHSAEAYRSGCTSSELQRNLEGFAENPRAEAAIRFAHAVLITRGRLEPRDFQRVRRQHFTNAELLSIVSLIGLSFHAAMLTNVDELK